MPRSRGGGSAPARRAPAARAPPPAAPARRAPPPAAPVPQQAAGGGMMSGLMGSVVQGMAFGTGSAIAHKAVGAVAGSMGGGGGEAAPAAAPQSAADMCANQTNTFYDCLHKSNGDASACNDYFVALNQCQTDAKAYA